MYKIKLTDDEVQKVLSGLHCEILSFMHAADLTKGTRDDADTGSYLKMADDYRKLYWNIHNQHFKQVFPENSNDTTINTNP